MSAHLRILTLGAFVALSAAACTPREAPVEALQPQVDALLEAGDAEGALALLGERDLSDDPALRQLLAEAQIMAGRFEGAHETLSTLEPTAAVDVLRGDACVMGALEAVDTGDDEIAASRMAPCAGDDRLDVASVRALVEARGAQQVDRNALDSLVERLHAAESSPETDVAAEALERTYRTWADHAPEDGDRIDWLLAAFEIGQDPELGAELVTLIQTTAEQVAEADPQAAATWYEFLYLDRVEGLPVSDEQRQDAARAAREVLFPIFVRNQYSRYLRKFGDDDTAAGRFDADAQTWTVAGGGDAETRAWLYDIYERPIPVEGPDLLAARGLCVEPGPCTLSVDELMGVLYRIDEIEDAWAEQDGNTITYLPPE